MSYKCPKDNTKSTYLCRKHYLSKKELVKLLSPFSEDTLIYLAEDSLYNKKNYVLMENIFDGRERAEFRSILVAIK